MPQDLIYLAQAESGFHPTALSRAGARGIWQFMASRAKGYGLERNLWLDERQDPERSTRAAAEHLKDLYKQFGDWYLAMAAYNSGPGTVQQAVKRTGYADFWELYKRNVLPRETRNYVPIILAVAIMAKNPAQYGLDDIVREQPVPTDTVKIDYPGGLAAGGGVHRYDARRNPGPESQLVALDDSKGWGAVRSPPAGWRTEDKYEGRPSRPFRRHARLVALSHRELPATRWPRLPALTARLHRRLRRLMTLEAERP